ncbi:MAG: hypothetical protein Q8O92_05325 [Candidatus Latescibacter sp.]|nr:hypothetical protein [Candidatus Latescibacter sp.]
MNRIIVIILTVIMLLAGSFFAEAQKSQLYYIHNYSADPAKTVELEAFIKDFMATLKKYSFPFPIQAYSTMDFQYYFFAPIENYADIDRIKKTLGDIGQKMGADNFQKLIARRNAAIQHHEYFVIRYLPELSWTPPKPRYKPEEALFRHWVFCYPRLDKESEMRAIFSKFVDLYKKTNSPFQEDVYTVEIGSDLPLFIGEERGKNLFEFYSSLEEGFKIIGEEGRNLWWKESMTLLRKIERRDGTYRPELSYIPDK